MSDEETKDDEKSKKKSSAEEQRPGDATEPVPKDKDFFEWLEGLFYGPTEFPEKLDCRVVSGSKYEKFGPVIAQKTYAAGEKPTRTQLVHLANKWIHAMQRDCDVQRKSLVYGIHVWHFTRDSEPYERYIKRMTPKGVYSPKSGGSYRESDEDEEEMSLTERNVLQHLGHQERMFALYGGGFESLMDRLLTTNERLEAAVERKDAKIEKLVDMLERALSLEAERNHKRVWEEMKAKHVGKALDTGMTYVGPILSRVLGPAQQGQPAAPGATAAIEPTLDSIALQNFMTSLPNEIADEVLGHYDSQNKLIKQGILTPEQAETLGAVAFCKLPVTRLDDLLPGGPYAISQEQVFKVQAAGISMEQLMPLLMIFETRQKARGK